ncbi:MAG: GMC family oxidoreductase [Candidatus Eremiobacteraeota bacterium]|nr:GMC family oxidoreductase [Candidatus Eremiobacteraeota bacterium]
MLTAREHSALLALTETLAPAGADVSATTHAVEIALQRLAPHRRAAMLTFLKVLDSPLGLALLTRAATRLRSAPPHKREAILRALGDHPLPLMRSGFAAWKRLIVFLAYSYEEATPNPLWPAIGYPGPRHDVPTTLHSLPRASLAANETLEADAVIVGSGAGGGVAAATLSAAGLHTIVLEAGPLADDIALQQREALSVASLYLDSGMAATEDAAISLLAGGCVGGGTTVNWCTALRLPEVTATQWGEASAVPQLPGELAAAYALVEPRLGLTVASHNRNNAVIVRGCERLGWHWQLIRRNASGCGDGCGYCGLGCAYGNKRSTAATFLFDAVRDGARIYAGVRVERITFENHRVTGVYARTQTSGGTTVRVLAPLVLAAAGALRTPGLLARSGIRSPHLGRHLFLHPTSPITAEFEDDVETWEGPMQTALCGRFSDDGSGYGVRIECAPAHPGLAALATPWRSQEQHASDLRRFRKAAVLIVLTRDRGEGRVSLDGRDDVSYELSSYDARHLVEGLIAAAAIALAAGARRVSTLHADPVVLERKTATGDALRAFADAVVARSYASNRIALFSAHQMGTARMHRDPRHGVVDAYGTVHGARGLIVADGSAFPRSSGVNPMLTIMALSQRASAHAVGHAQLRAQRHGSPVS